MTTRRSRSLAFLAALTSLLVVAACPVTFAQDPGPAADATAQEDAASEVAGEEDLAATEARLKDRFSRLELLVGRQAEVSASTQPRRAALLRQLITQSRERDVTGQFDRVIAALERESYSTALDSQNALEAELQKLLDLLLQEDRDREIESQRKRIGRYLQDLNRIIRLQRGVKARTDGGDDQAELADDQQRIGDRTKELGDEIDENENDSSRSPSSSPSGEPRSEGQQQPSSSKPSSDGPSDRGDGERSDQKGDKPSQDQQPNEQQGRQSDENENQGRPSDAQPGQNSPDQPGQPSQGEPSQGSPSGEGQQGQQSPSQQSSEQTPMQRAAERLRQAQQRMEEARQRLEQSQRDGALQEQQQAVEQLEQAKAELERILRQLREEELERMLVMLEARFRKMLDSQVEVYEETKKLDAAAGKVPAHELEIAGGRLSRKENGIVREADRALVLLREDGTSVAFPEAIEQARDDMQSIAERLQDAKFEMITQGLEEDVIEALEQALASLQQALKDLRDQQSGQGQPGGGQPGEQPLVDNLAELRMIRALQKRVKDRTERYGNMIEGEQAYKADLLEALDELSLRQQKIFQATRDLSRQEK